jgi:hypothetical protein
VTKLCSIEYGSSAQTVAKMLRVLFPDAKTVLDMTYGSGKFWTSNTPWRVTGIDLNPERARDVCADFTRLPFTNGAFDVSIFDPPYLTDASCSGLMAMDRHFSSFASVDAAQRAVSRGVTEAWRVGRIGCIVKVQNYTHASRSVRMTQWVEDALPERAYGEVHAVTPSKIFDPKWGQQLSVYSVHTTYLAFRHGSQMHVRRGSPLAAVTVQRHEQAALFAQEAV